MLHYEFDVSFVTALWLLDHCSFQLPKPWVCANSDLAIRILPFLCDCHLLLPQFLANRRGCSYITSLLSDTGQLEWHFMKFSFWIFSQFGWWHKLGVKHSQGYRLLFSVDWGLFWRNITIEKFSSRPSPDETQSCPNNVCFCDFRILIFRPSFGVAACS